MFMIRPLHASAILYALRPQSSDDMLDLRGVFAESSNVSSEVCASDVGCYSL